MISFFPIILFPLSFNQGSFPTLSEGDSEDLYLTTSFLLLKFMSSDYLSYTSRSEKYSAHELKNDKDLHHISSLLHSHLESSFSFSSNFPEKLKKSIPSSSLKESLSFIESIPQKTKAVLMYEEIAFRGVKEFSSYHGVLINYLNSFKIILKIFREVLEEFEDELISSFNLNMNINMNTENSNKKSLENFFGGFISSLNNSKEKGLLSFSKYIRERTYLDLPFQTFDGYSPEMIRRYLKSISKDYSFKIKKYYKTLKKAIKKLNYEYFYILSELEGCSRERVVCAGEYWNLHSAIFSFLKVLHKNNLNTIENNIENNIITEDNKEERYLGILNMFVLGIVSVLDKISSLENEMKTVFWTGTVQKIAEFLDKVHKSEFVEKVMKYVNMMECNFLDFMSDFFFYKIFRVEEIVQRIFRKIDKYL